LGPALGLAARRVWMPSNLPAFARACLMKFCAAFHRGCPGCIA